MPSCPRRAPATGRRAEAHAAQWLADRGWKILGRNVRIGHLEIDIVAQLDDVVSVVEVRARGPGAWRRALDSVDVAKQSRLRAAARQLWDTRWCHDPSIRVVRFDIVVVDFGPGDVVTVDWVQGAFQ